MVVRCGSLLGGCLILLLVVCNSAAAQPRPIPNRPDVYEIGDPYPITRATLSMEMRRNDELRLYITQYGFPDYAEVQELVPQWPWADYEVRLYYLDRDIQLAFGRVFIAPAFPNYGNRRSIDHISAGTLHRLLTARPISGKGMQQIPPSAPEQFSPPRPPGPSEEDLEKSQPIPPSDEGQQSMPNMQIQVPGSSAPASVLAQNPTN